MYEHRHGGLPCEGSGQETEECNAWLDTKSDLLACQTKSENSTTELARCNYNMYVYFTLIIKLIIKLKTSLLGLD